MLFTPVSGNRTGVSSCKAFLSINAITYCIARVISHILSFGQPGLYSHPPYRKGLKFAKALLAGNNNKE